jgi:D-sedoheptulose 7-phosphate isomerase
VTNLINHYFDTLAGAIRDVEVTDANGKAMVVEEAFDRVCRSSHRVHDAGKKILFIGNGGSAGIASHLAIDFTKNGKLRSLAFNDPSALTALGNDLGYENVFAKQIEYHAAPGDMVIAISSSGKSPNILAGVSTARQHGCEIVTFSGFTETNDLRKTGDVNFYVRATEYGFVEVAHLSICHAILDLDMGWGAAKR